VTEPDLLLALGPVLEVLRGLGVRHYVGGSIASSAHGVPRASIDVDVMAELAPAHTERLIAALRGTYYIPEHRVTAAIALQQSFNVIHFDSMIKVDVFVSRGRSFDDRALDRAQATTLEGVGNVPLLSAEDTVLAKLDWFRRGGEVSERQWSDVVGVLRVSGPLDRAYLDDGARELGVADLLERARAEVEQDQEG
jgi:hypothetical protein